MRNKLQINYVEDGKAEIAFADSFTIAPSHRSVCLVNGSDAKIIGLNAIRTINDISYPLLPKRLYMDPQLSQNNHTLTEYFVITFEGYMYRTYFQSYDALSEYLKNLEGTDSKLTTPHNMFVAIKDIQDIAEPGGIVVHPEEEKKRDRTLALYKDDKLVQMFTDVYNVRLFNGVITYDLDNHKSAYIDNIYNCYGYIKYGNELFWINSKWNDYNFGKTIDGVVYHFDKDGNILTVPKMIVEWETSLQKIKPPEKVENWLGPLLKMMEEK